MNIDQQVAYLMRGTDYGDDTTRKMMEKELRERLILAEKEGRPLRIYCGYDPTKPDLHIGHTVTMRKLRQFQELGHHVVFLIGTYTSLIGDPSDKDKLRPVLTPEQVQENAETYANQAFKVLDREKTELRYNAEWLDGLMLKDMIHLASNFTIQQFLTRENFRKRWDKDEPVYFHELFYAILQGYDAYKLDTDVQVGGTDQMFNIMTAGRKVMAYFDKKPNIGIILPILPGTDGELKMSKSLGNDIPLETTPEDMFGKVMSIPDKAMGSYSRLVTRWTNEQIEAFEKAMSDGDLHPRDAKMELAKEITSAFFGDEAAEHAKQEFINMFQKGDMPDEIPEFHPAGEPVLLEVLVNSELVKSKSQARRLIDQKGVKIDGETAADPYMILSLGAVIQVGKRRFVKII